MYDFSKINTKRSLGENIDNRRIIISEAVIKQSNLLNTILNSYSKFRTRSKADKEKKKKYS